MEKSRGDFSAADGKCSLFPHSCTFEKYVNENYFLYVVDTDAEDPEPYGAEYEAEDAMFVAMTGRPSVTREPMTDEFGTFYSGYTPISYNGQMLGFVGVDYDASFVRASLNSLVLNVMIAVVAGILFAVLIALFASVSDASEENSSEIISASELLMSVDEDMKNIGISTAEHFLPSQ